ncbi:putative recombinase [Gottschalkia purinilytica]|uniref:Holliday junction resolvase RecU n=1 Tax=Gottschalkia purinilytica TaxID=1503 RepID=A0A0L0WBR9_GOTPU|nr:Holliday junction resolvase RecU [Gottschalkia purinilytica]KNF08926.1 putative recombinase [Gottschalkia purinilytica]
MKESYRIYGNRGMLLENIIEIINNQYRSKGIADINKLPTPIKILRIDRVDGVYGHLERKNTVDFSGLAKINNRTISIAFDAKENLNITKEHLGNANIEIYKGFVYLDKFEEEV